MANNYDVSVWSNNETTGDNMSYIIPNYLGIASVNFWITGNENGQINVPTLYITPKENNSTQFVVSAENFRIGQGFFWGYEMEEEWQQIIFKYVNGENGNNFSYPVKEVHFSDTTTPNTPSNTVKVQVILEADYQMPDESVLIEIDIDTYGPLSTWDPSLASYRTAVLLTNQIWPNENIETESQLEELGIEEDYIRPWTNYRNPPEDFNGSSTSYYNSGVDYRDNSIPAFSIEEDGDGNIPQTINEYSDAYIFWKAGYVDSGQQSFEIGEGSATFGAPGLLPEVRSWRVWETRGQQTVSILDNTVIYQLNSPIENTQPQLGPIGIYITGLSDTLNANQGITWASDNPNSIGSTFNAAGTNEIAQDSNGDYYRVIKWRIRPRGSDWTVAASDFNVMSWDVRTWSYSNAYSPGYIDPETDNPCLNILPGIQPQNGTNPMPNPANSIGELGGFFPILCEYEDIDGNTQTRASVDSPQKGFGYFYLDGIGTESTASFTGDDNVNDITCDECWGDINKISHYKYKMSPSEFDTFLGYSGPQGTTFTNNINSPIYLFTKPKGFKNPQGTSPPPTSSIYDPSYSTFIPYEPIYDNDGNGVVLSSSTNAHDKETGSCGAGNNVLARWVTFHDVYNEDIEMNEVEVTAWVCPNFIPAIGDNKDIYIFQINGRARENADPEGMPGGIDYDFDVIDPYNYNNSGGITIDPRQGVSASTRKTITTLKESTINGGSSNERKIYNFSGNVPYNEPTTIATIKFEADTDSAGNYTHRFQKTPHLTTDSVLSRLNKGLPDSIKLVLKSRTSNNLYTFDLIYHNNVSTSKADKLKTNLNFRQLAKVTKTLDIQRVNYGSSTMQISGGTRDITIYGKKGATFTILVNKVAQYKDTDGNLTNATETSILGTHTGKTVVNVTSNRGETFRALQGTIGVTGKYSFKQKFPQPVEANNALIETPYNIHILPSIAGGSILNWDTSGDFPGYYTNTITQYLNPKLTLKATASTQYAITHVDGVATSFAAGDDYSSTYIGRPNATRQDVKNINSIKKSFTLTYKLNGAGSKYFNNFRVPYFSNLSEYDGNNTYASTNVSTSDWTNTIPSLNGGTQVFIENITRTLSADGGISNGICDISFEVIIEKWGTKDVTMELDLDKLLTTTT